MSLEIIRAPVWPAITVVLAAAAATAAAQTTTPSDVGDMTSPAPSDPNTGNVATSELKIPGVN